MITIVDYGLGNLNSIKNMLKRVGFRSEISSDPNVILAADKLILPGVGAFDHGMRNIASRGLRESLDRKALEEKVPVLGICLGMQLLCEGSEEGNLPGLGWISGRARLFKFSGADESLKVPHMGWNEVVFNPSHPLTRDFRASVRFYFVHSYKVECSNAEDVLMTAEYGGPVVAAVASGNIMGTQFHPEKSHKFGMQLLRNFAEL